MLGQEVGDGGSDGAAADVVVAGEGRDGPAFQVRSAHGVGPVGRDGGAASARRGAVPPLMLEWEVNKPPV